MAIEFVIELECGTTIEGDNAQAVEMTAQEHVRKHGCSGTGKTNISKQDRSARP